MPTSEGWPTVDEERAMKAFVREQRKNPDLTPNTLPMNVTLTLDQWRAVIDGEPPAIDYLRSLVQAHGEMVASLRALVK